MAASFLEDRDVDSEIYSDKRLPLQLVTNKLPLTLFLVDNCPATDHNAKKLKTHFQQSRDVEVKVAKTHAQASELLRQWEQLEEVNQHRENVHGAVHALLVIDINFNGSPEEGLALVRRAKQGGVPILVNSPEDPRYIGKMLEHEGLDGIPAVDKVHDRWLATVIEDVLAGRTPPAEPLPDREETN